MVKESTFQMENPELTIDSLHLLKQRIENNTADVSDYQKLDYFLTSINLGGYVLKKINERGYHSYQSYIDQRKLPPSYKKDNLSEGYIFGIIKECISMLFSFLNSNR